MFGLVDKDINEIKSCLRIFPEVEIGLIFGSRARGDFKNGSDVDLALKGARINFKIISRISCMLNEETNMPYHFDVVNYSEIESKDLKLQIDRAGIILYQKESAFVAQEPDIKYEDDLS